MSRSFHRRLSLLFLLSHFLLPSLLSGQNLDKIPQRIYFSAVDIEKCDVLPPDALEMFHAALARKTALVRVFSEKEAHSAIELSCSEQRKGPLSIDIVFRHFEEGELAEYSGPAEELQSWDNLITFMKKAAETIAPAIEPVVPEIEVVESDGKTQAAEESLIFEGTGETLSYIEKAKAQEARAATWSYGLWATGLVLPVMGGGDDEEESDDDYRIDPSPIILNVNYFPKRHFGYRGSLYLHYEQRFTFGRAFDPVSGFELFDTRASTNNLFLLPGLGVQFRTLGKTYVSAGFDAYGGLVIIDNPNNFSVGKGDEFIDREVVGPKDSAAYFYSYFSMRVELGYSFNPHWSAGLRTAQYFFPGFWAGMFDHPKYDLNEHAFFIQFLSLGIEYRK